MWLGGLAGDDGWVLVEGPGTLPASAAGSEGFLGPCLMKPKCLVTGKGVVKGRVPTQMGPCVHGTARILL